jgi:dTDP-4-dehydrorhamnose reductase
VKNAVQQPKLLVTGASGLLGGVLCRLAVDKWDVCGVYHRHSVQVAGVRAFQVDLTRRDDVDDLLCRIEPDAVIHAAAVADVGRCERHPDRTADINVGVPARLAAWCSQNAVPFSFTSTDLVFDGNRPPYKETSPVNPISDYARQKIRAESDVLKCCSQAAIFRLPLMIGVSARADARHFCRQMLDAIHEGHPLTLFSDEYRTPVDIYSAAKGILGLLGRVQGIVHLGGRTRVSRLALGLMMAEAMGRRPDMISSVRIAEMSGAGPRAGDVSLDSSHAFDQGYAPMPLKAAVQSVVDQYLVISNG